MVSATIFCVEFNPYRKVADAHLDAAVCSWGAAKKDIRRATTSRCRARYGSVRGEDCQVIYTVAIEVPKADHGAAEEAIEGRREEDAVACGNAQDVDARENCVRDCLGEEQIRTPLPIRPGRPSPPGGSQ